ncbi:hypothetical protein DYBT9275_04495 [Dyadobacter sp. CECT 9275]|uniref:Lipoprotein n=1 Tax=Dyadobacter helix TaxID=2822344 RepID=A0A916JGT2_9BACT|nr:hypothetical protein [Dyadobacter sp. CECT 9275]CAG5009425.1 hypothetical protein DYBT9275_04495 [Dyadobacter sp. CECT 9275]
MKRITVIIIVLSLFGYACSKKVNFENVHANVPAFNQKISVATWDQREQIVSGSRKPDFVGYMRSGAGIAYPMGTTSGKPLANLISNNVSSSLSAQGSTASVIATNANQSELTILSNLKKSGKNRLILINCKQLHMDGTGGRYLLYNLIVNVYTGNGTVIKQKAFTGKKPLGGSWFFGPGKYKQYMPEALKNLIGEVFNDADIVSALKAK